MLHYAEAIKAIMNEELGDGIMSAIDMFATIDTIKGKAGEDRLVITLNGKVRASLSQKFLVLPPLILTAASNNLLGMGLRRLGKQEWNEICH